MRTHRYIYVPYKLDAQYLYITDRFHTNSTHDYYILQIGLIQTPRTIFIYYRYVPYKLDARLLHITDMFDTIVDHDTECLPRAIIADGCLNVGGAPSLGFPEGPTSAAL